ncbi:MAG TPA: DUF2262 domain-containing protein [Verrucomicrobiae bacterium]|nr:DUF2262 domain-containing protein [Verrucomicrobiae bacterium]
MSELIKDELFGSLKYDVNLRWYLGQVEFSPGHRVELSISVEGVDPYAAIQRARQTFPRVQSREAELRRAAAREKLALYNDQWSEGEKIDANEFMRRIALSSVTIHPEGEVQLWYADGNLFAGHWIAVSTDSELQFQHVEIAG